MKAGLDPDITVANLRTATGQDPHESTADLVGEWSTGRVAPPLGVHIVHTHAGGNQHVHHVVGHLDIAYEGMEPRSEPGLLMTVVTAEPESLTAHALTLTLLASWAAT